MQKKNPTTTTTKKLSTTVYILHFAAMLQSMQLKFVFFVSSQEVNLWHLDPLLVKCLCDIKFTGQRFPNLNFGMLLKVVVTKDIKLHWLPFIYMQVQGWVAKFKKHKPRKLQVSEKVEMVYFHILNVLFDFF